MTCHNHTLLKIERIGVFELQLYSSNFFMDFQRCICIGVVLMFDDTSSIALELDKNEQPYLNGAYSSSYLKPVMAV